jgi:hypothetical protein
LRAADGGFQISLEPRFVEPVPLSSGAVLSVPQQLCVSGETRYAPAIAGLRPWGEIGDLLAAADLAANFQAFPAPADFRLVLTAKSLQGSLKSPMSSPVGYIGEALSPGDCGSALTPPVGSFRRGVVVLPNAPPSGPVAPIYPDSQSTPRVGDFDGAATVDAFRTLSGIGKAFDLAAAEAPPWILPPISSCAHILSMPPSLAGPGFATAELARFPFPLHFPKPVAALDLGGFDLHQTARPPAGFAGELPPLALTGVCRTRHGSADFSLYPVWLPELFTLSGLRGGLRRARGFNPFTAVSPGGSGQSQHEAGPGFSGQLEFPLPAAAVCEFAEKRPTIFNTSLPTLPQPRGGELFLRNAADLWRTAPALARGMALGVPLMALAFFYGPKPSLSGVSPDWSAVGAKIRDRAAIDVQEDFQSGLAAWTGKPGWESSWGSPQDGSAQPGRLALNRPTLALRDYHFELQGYIVAKGMGLVFRAADLDNYYAAKFVIKKAGPLPSVALVRYAVIGGRAEPKTETPIPLYLREDTLYKVLVTVEGEHFTIGINGQMVDAWSDSRLTSGGVGLFADKGEIAHLRSVQVVDQQDFLGWLCSQVSAWTADRRTLGVKHE